MKSRTNAKTRLLALVLTALMAVGVLSFSAFAFGGTPAAVEPGASGTSYKTPTAAQIVKALGNNGTLVYYNDFNSAPAGTTLTPAYQSNQTVLTNAAAIKPSNSIHRVNGVTATIVADGDNDNALKLQTIADTDFCYDVHLAGWRNPIAANSGKDFVFSVDVKMEGGVTDGALLNLESRFNNNTNNETYCWEAIPLWVDSSGKVYATDFNWTNNTGSGGGVTTHKITGGCVWGMNGWDKTKIQDNVVDKENVLCTLSTTDYTNLAIQVKDNKISIYVDGVKKVDSQTFMSATALNAYTAISSGQYADGFALTGFGYYYRKQKSVNGICIDNNVLYFADELVSLYGTDYTSALTEADFEKNPNSTLLHYNNFDNQTAGTAPATFASTLAIGNNLSGVVMTGLGETIVDDGNGGKAFTYEYSSSSGGFYQANGFDNSLGAPSVNAGKNFVVAADFKLEGTPKGQLINATASGLTSGIFSAGLVYTKDGKIYISKDTDEGVFVNNTTSAWETNATEIGQLSDSQFTNIAVAVNVENNTYKVYIDGFAATKDVKFLSDADKTTITADASYTDGFGLSYAVLNILGDNTGAIQIDNVAAYLGNDIINRAIEFYIKEDGITEPLNGYHEVEPGTSRFYKNGERVTGFVVLDDGSKYYVNSDNTMFGGYKVINGLNYFFDAADSYKGELLNGVCTLNSGASYGYYVNGVVQVGLIDADNTKYYGDLSTGDLQTGICTDVLTSKSYYFYDDGANKFKMAVGVSVKVGDSIITVGEDGVIDEESGKVFGKWTEIDGVYYYSDSTGKLANGFAYVEKAPNGSEGGYYFFEGGIMKTESFVTVYGTTIYFHEDGRAPSGVVLVKNSAENHPDAAPADGYMYFDNGVLVLGTVEAIYDGQKFTFKNGRFESKEAVSTTNPELLVIIMKDGRENSFYLNTEEGGKLDKLFTSYPCYTLTVYDVTTGEYVKLAPDAVTGKYSLTAGHTYEARYKAVDHVFSATRDEVASVAPTCGKDGYDVFKCVTDGCLATHKVTVKATGVHDFSGDPEVIVAPTCITKGVGVIKCDCGAVKTVDLEPTGHIFPAETDASKWTVSSSATCTQEGYKYAECKHFGVCGQYIHKSIPRTEHNFSAWTDVTGSTANCMTGVAQERKCGSCGETETRYAAPDYTKHVHGNIANENDAYAQHFVLFEITKPSTCKENGSAIYQCKYCGGFVYNVVLELDPDNHHYEGSVEYLVVLDDDGNVIETLTGNSREEMLGISKKICGNRGEWRVDCVNGCVYEQGKTYFKKVADVDATYAHSFDYTVFYTTTDETDPLYGYHYHKCGKCGTPVAAVAHESVYTYNNDGTHTHTCICIVEATGNPYEVANETCQPVGKHNDTHHWTECICGNKTAEIPHTPATGKDATHHWTINCECGYINKVAHSWEDKDGLDSTCHSLGYTAYKECTCGRIEGKNTINMKPHNVTGVYATDGTHHWYKCENDGCTFIYSKQQHSLIDIPAKAATCTESGYIAHQMCSICGYKAGYTEMPQLAHNVAGQPYNYNAEQHWQICTNCNQPQYGTHGYADTPSSDEEGTFPCTTTGCGHVKVDTAATWWGELGLTREGTAGSYYYTYGEAVDSLETIGEDKYYFDTEGKLAMNTRVEIDGIWYTIDNRGKATEEEE